MDDFWGETAWEQWTREFAKAMPRAEYPIEDVPLTDPIFQSMFDVKEVPQVTEHPVLARQPRDATPRNAAKNPPCRTSAPSATNTAASSR